ncbi:PREDICTED: taste receptor type 2 member 38 [Miniopterus natalensis]|uniref:taste receptor type 2 member 38 n=1 Tax=Miniopterus natalensis TaxID=291302 RepID=UPI0007A71B40|nr:PREDICTED: taste receptor type 2 member 38 [Miniopterus natalensis]
MLALIPTKTVFYEVKCVFLFLSVLEFTVGILANVFILLVYFRDMVRRQPLSTCDLVLLSLSFTRLFLHGVLLLDVIQLTHFQSMKEPLSLSFQITVMLWMMTEQADLWLSTCLSFLYCSKIVRSSHSFLLSLFSWISRKISRMLLGAVFFTSVCMVICSSHICRRPHLTVTTVLFIKNDTEHNLQTAKLQFFHSFLLCSLGSIPPFLCFLVSSGVLIVSLWRHMRTMRAKTTDSRDPSLEAHLKALRFLISFLCLFVLSFCAALLSVPLLVLWYNKFGVMVCLVVMAACPLGHSAILISGNAKLRRTVDGILQWLQSRPQQATAGHKADPRPPDLC